MRSALRHPSSAVPRHIALALVEERDRLVADLANVRRHQAEAETRAERNGLVRAGLELAQIHDSLVLALGSNPEPGSPWALGTAGVLAQVRTSLTRLGLQAVGAPGDRFDPAVHEAVGTVEDPTLPSGSVAVVQTVGFRFDDGHLLRPAQVVVVQGGAR